MEVSEEREWDKVGVLVWIVEAELVEVARAEEKAAWLGCREWLMRRGWM